MPTYDEIDDLAYQKIIQEKDGQIARLKAVIERYRALIAQFIDHLEAISWTAIDRKALIQRAKEAIRPS